MSEALKTIVLIFGSAAFGGAVAGLLDLRRRSIMLDRQRLETLRLLRAEFLYWQGLADSDKADDTQRTIAKGGTAAASNVLAAVMGSPAPWHGQDYVRTSEVAAAAEASL